MWRGWMGGEPTKAGGYEEKNNFDSYRSMRPEEVCDSLFFSTFFEELRFYLDLYINETRTTTHCGKYESYQREKK